jgi:hypothetical protein
LTFRQKAASQRNDFHEHESTILHDHKWLSNVRETQAESWQKKIKSYKTFLKIFQQKNKASILF